MPLAKTDFHIFHKGESLHFAAGDSVPEDVAKGITNKEGCLEDAEVFETDYSTMQVQVLKEIVLGRGLVPEKTKAKLIAQLEESDV